MFPFAQALKASKGTKRPAGAEDDAKPKAKAKAKAKSKARSVGSNEGAAASEAAGTCEGSGAGVEGSAPGGEGSGAGGETSPAVEGDGFEGKAEKKTKQPRAKATPEMLSAAWKEKVGNPCLKYILIRFICNANVIHAGLRILFLSVLFFFGPGTNPQRSWCSNSGRI